MMFKYVNKTGMTAFAGVFFWAGPFWKGLACVKGEDFGWGFIDSQGTLKIRAPDFQSEPTGFFDGLALIRQGRLYGYMDLDGKIYIRPQYRNAEPFSNGLAPVQTSKGYTFIDTTGNILMQQCFSDVNHFSEGLALVKRGSHYYFLNRAFKSVLGPFERAFDFRDGIARVRFENTECFINHEGEVVFENNWEYLESGSSEGRICFAENGRYGFVDTGGKVVIPVQYDEARNFSEGIAMVKLNCDNFGINLRGERLFSARFDKCMDFSDGLLAFERERKWGYLDTSGKCVIPEQFDVANIFREGLAPVTID